MKVWKYEQGHTDIRKVDGEVVVSAYSKQYKRNIDLQNKIKVKQERRKAICTSVGNGTGITLRTVFTPKAILLLVVMTILTVTGIFSIKKIYDLVSGFLSFTYLAMIGAILLAAYVIAFVVLAKLEKIVEVRYMIYMFFAGILSMSGVMGYLASRYKLGSGEIVTSLVWTILLQLLFVFLSFAIINYGYCRNIEKTVIANDDFEVVEDVVD